MRAKIKFTKNNVLVPFNNQSIINSYIHKCLGTNNKYHDTKSNYCISQLYGGKMNENKNGLEFKDGAYIVITSLDTEFINTLFSGIINEKFELGYGMYFLDIEYIEEKFYDGWNYFSTLSPFIIKKYTNNNKNAEFFTLYDDNFEKIVQQYLIKKISKINSKLDLSNFKVEIKKHPKHKVKKIMVKNVVNQANQCQVNIFCSKKVAELIYNYGLGQSTGSGFGTVYKTENHSIYKNRN